MGPCNLKKKNSIIIFLIFCTSHSFFFFFFFFGYILPIHLNKSRFVAAFEGQCQTILCDGSLFYFILKKKFVFFFLVWWVKGGGGRCVLLRVFGWGCTFKITNNLIDSTQNNKNELLLLLLLLFLDAFSKKTKE